MDLSQYTTDELDRALAEQLKQQMFAGSHTPVTGVPVSSHNPRIVEPYPNAPSLRTLSPEQKQRDYRIPVNLYQPEGMEEVNRAKRQYQTDIDGLLQLGKMGAEAATVLPQVVSGGLAGGAALTGAKIGGATWDESLGSYNEASDAAKGVVQEILGQPSEFMGLLSTHGFEPVNQYITEKSGDPRLGERLMDLFMMKGGLAGRTGKLAEFGTKAANAGLITGLAATQPTFDLTSTSDADLNKAALALVGGTMAVESRSPIKQQIFELQKAIRETADPTRKADLGRQIKELQQSKPTQNLPVPVERPLIDPEGPTFQLKSLNAINQLKPEMKLNGPQLYKHLKRNGVSDAEIDSVLGDIKTVGPITTVARWASQVEQSAPKINVDVYGGKSRTEKPYVIQTGDNEFTVYDQDTHTELMTSSTMEGARTYANSVNLGPSKPAIYQSWFKDDIAKFGSDPSTYQVAQLGVELPGSPQTLDAIAQEMFGKNHAQLGTDAKRIVFDEYLHRSESGRYVSPSWKNEHSEIDTPNSLAGFITSETKLPSGETVTVMHEGQPARIVREQALSVEATARKLAKDQSRAWDEIPESQQENFRKQAKEQKTKNPVPEPLAERAMELAAKQMIAQAKEAGHAGILLQTGPEIAKRWNLTNWFDEARYNPETQMLTMYKNGQVKIAPRHVPPEKLGETLNSQELADRLLASKTGEEVKISTEASLDSAENVRDLWQSTHPEANYEIRQNKNTTEWEVFSKGSNEHVLKDLSIDKPWTTVEYGRFEGGDTVKTPSVDKIDKATFDSVRSKFLNDFPDADGHIKRFLLDIADSKKEIDNLSNSTVRWLDVSDLDLPTVYDWLSENYGVTSSTGGQYIPGKVANTLKRLTGGEIELVDVGEVKPLKWQEGDFADNNGAAHWYSGDWEIVRHDGGFDVNYDGRYKNSFATKEEAEAYVNNDVNGGSSTKRPFLRFTKDTPKTFSIYEWAAMTGLTAAMIQEYLDADDYKKQRMMNKLPALGMLL